MSTASPPPPSQGSAWPDDEFNLAAARIADSIWQLAIRPDAWIRRRSELVEIPDPATVRRSTTVEFVLPTGPLGARLQLPRAPGCHAVPVGFIPKRPLRRLEVATGAVKLSSEQVDRMALSLAATWLHDRGAETRSEALRLLGQVIRHGSGGAGDAHLVAAFAALFDEGPERARADFLARSLAAARPLVFAVRAPLGAPASLAWTVDEDSEQRWTAVQCLGLRPLPILVHTTAAAPYQPSYHVDFLAPEGFEIEDAGIVPARDRRALAELVRDPRFAVDRSRQGLTGAHVHVPRRGGRGLEAALLVHLGYERRVLPRNAALAAAAIALLLSVYAALSSSVRATAGGFLLAAPALLVGAVASYSAPSTTMRAADHLRLLVLVAVLLAIGGGTLVSLSGDGQACAPALAVLAAATWLLAALAALAGWRRGVRLD